MKLYATVSSERASKGQGGNEFLYLKIQGAGPGVATLLDVEFMPEDDGSAYIGSVSGDINLMRVLIDRFNSYIQLVLDEQKKGNKQEGERCWHESVRKQNGKEICNNCELVLSASIA